LVRGSAWLVFGVLLMPSQTAAGGVPFLFSLTLDRADYGALIAVAATLPPA
jgi:hypothetical protein